MSSLFYTGIVIGGPAAARIWYIPLLHRDNGKENGKYCNGLYRFQVSSMFYPEVPCAGQTEGS